MGRRKIAAGLAGAALVGGGFTFFSSQGSGSIDTFVGSTPTPVPALTANLWIDSNGGTCTRQATAGAYVDAAACSGAQAALTAASCGDRVRYVSGTYSEQTITTSGLSCTTSTRVVFSPANDTPNVYGTPSSVVLQGINADAVDCWCRFQDFDTYSDTTTDGTLHAATGGTIGSELPHDDPAHGVTGGSNAEGSSWASFVRIDATNSYYAASDVEQVGGSIGGYDACNGTAGNALDQDATKLWGAPGHIANRVTINGTLYHDIHNTCTSPTGNKHIDMMQIGGGDGDVIENVRGYDLPDQGIFARPYSVGSPLLSNLTVKNNMIGSFSTDDINGDGSTSIGICNSGDDCSNTIDVENNTVGSAIDVFPGGRNIVNNYAAGGFTAATTGTVAFSNNAYATINPPGGTSNQHCTPTFTSPTATADATADYHLGALDTCLTGHGSATVFAATDIDGDTRPLGSGSDIGADEVG